MLTSSYSTILLRSLSFLIATASLVISQGILRADPGDDNPTGVAGWFNGQVQSGCSYDPLTGNAKRQIMDILVPGSVSAYPLAFTRTMNSRVDPSVALYYPFGRAGAWRHTYQWEIKTERIYFTNCEAGQGPNNYTVTYPDGRKVTFGSDGSSTAPGIPERISPVFDPFGTASDCYLDRGDGGRIHFTVAITQPICGQGPYYSEFVFKCAGITDPHGQETTITWSSGHIDTIKEPAGRNLKLFYRGFNNETVIDRVEERAGPNAPLGRTVKYNYTGFGLENVEYFNDPALTARYTYQASNAGGTNPPLIRTCDDSMYSGPMSKIAYDFAQGRPHGFLWRERYFDGTDAINGPAVSTLTIDSANPNKRIETRGDGPSRTFTYSGGFLKSWTDFKNPGVPSSQDHNPNGFVSYVIDGRTNKTDFERHPLTGNITQVTHPWTPSDPADQPGKVLIEYPTDDPYYVRSVTNERLKKTTYTRDQDSHQILHIDYPDSGHEGYLYNSFGQVTWHQRKNDAIESFDYDDDNRGLLIHRWNPVPGTNTPQVNGPLKTVFAYYPVGHPWQDRVQTVKDPRGKVTTFEYDRLPAGPTGQMHAGRGLVSKITYPDTKYVSFGYDRCANTLSEQNEVGEITSYTYDDYNRVTHLTAPLPNNRTATTTYAYTPTYYPNIPSVWPYLHTARTPASVTSPTGIVVENGYDANHRLKQSTRGTGPGAVTTRYGYDEVGNLSSVTDPRLYETVIEYDQRNRQKKATGPPISAANNIPYVTEWFYDPASNVRQIILPDLNEINRDYDEMNRLLTSDLTSRDHQEHRVTTYAYYTSGQIRTLRDPKDQITTFEYDERDLKTKMIYPDQTILEGWQYDANGNTKERPTIGGPKQWFSYDDRNRLKTMRWSNGIDFSDFGYDDAGRLTSAINPYSSITRLYDGGRLELDRQVLAATFNPPSMTITPIGVVSRKNHGSAGSFDISLPLAGSPGIECRLGPSYSLVLTFANPVTVGGATVTSGIGNVVSATASGNVVAVNLTEVSNAQVITVKIFGLSDGANAGELIIPMHVLIGDTTADAVTNSDDSQQTQDREDQLADASNFRSDVNTDGTINSEDVMKVTVTAGVEMSSLPAAAPQADVWYEYDDEGRLYTLSTPAYAYRYTYDALGRLEWIKRTDNPDHIKYKYSYDPSSNITGRTSYTNNTSLSFGRDEVNRITDEAILNGEDPLSHLHHTYDKMSRLEATTRDEDTLRDRFGYNFAGELNLAEYGLHPDGNGGYHDPSAAISYIHDDAGNRLSVNGATYTPNALNQYVLAQDSPVDNGSQHEISGYQGKGYSYRADGQLSGVDSAIGVQNVGNSYRLGYDALGRTVRRSMNGEVTYFIYDGARSIIEYNAAGGITANTLYGLGIDEIISRHNNGTDQFLMQDRTGSTVAVTGSKGQLLEQYRYDAFGTPTIMDPEGNGTPDNETTINNRFLFTGREWVSRFGFYEYRARAYHPGLGRFMSQDPIGFAAGDLNLFRYCGNDPLNMVDPSGLDQRTITAGLGLGVMMTWGTNNGQSNFGFYLGIGLGGSYSYTPSTSEYVFPGVIPGIAGQFTQGVGENASVNVSVLNSTRGGNATATTGIGHGKHGLQFGVEIDPLKSPPYGPASPSYGYMNGMFIGIGATSYGEPKAPPPGGTTEVDPSICPGCPTTEREVVTSSYLPSTPSFYSFHADPNTFFSPGFGSGLNSGSHGGASAASVLSTLFQTKAGIPGGGGQPGEGTHPVPFELN